MAIVAGDERLIAAHETTVRETLQEVEKYAATRVRLASLNENRTTGNWVMAAYTHDTSRELDPQPHTHAVAANLTYDGAEARWKTLQAFGLYERRSYLTEIYRNALAREVCALGYEIENRRHVAAKKSHSHGASKRQAHEDSCRAIHRAGRGTASYPEGADTDDGFVAVFTGLRVGELLGLKWSDIDLQKMVIHVVRSIVMQHVGDCKTEASRKPVLLDLRLAKVLWDWRLQSPYPTDEDSVFASPHSGGKLPYWPGSLYKARTWSPGERSRNRGQLRLAYVPAHVRDTPQRQRRGRESCARAHAAREHLGHVEHLRASDHAVEARRAEPGCEPAARQKRRKNKHRGFIGR
jgi:integrase